MATLADELLHDFDDSDAEGENGIDEAVEDVEPGEAAQETNRKRRRRDSDDVAANGMELDDDEEEVGDPDDLMAHSSAKAAEDAAEDHEEAKARIEKLQLKGVDDVRSVAGLMKKLSPVLEVRLQSPFSLVAIGRQHELLLCYSHKDAGLRIHP